MSENEQKKATVSTAKTTTKATTTPRKKRAVDPAIKKIMDEAKRKVWAIKLTSGLDADQLTSLQAAMDERGSLLSESARNVPAV